MPDDRCGAKTRAGTPCKQHPVKGRKRCRLHGGLSTGPKGGHGLRSRHFRQLRDEGAERLQQIMDDPELLNLRRPLAMQHLVLEQVRLDMTDQDIREWLARGDEEPEDITQARVEHFRADMVHRFVRMLESYSRRQEAVLKQQRAGDLIVAGALPIITEYGRRVVETVKRYVPQELHPQLERDLKAQANVVVAQLGRLGDE